MTMGFDPIRLIASREFESHLRRHRLPRGVVNTLETKKPSSIFTYLPRVEKVEAAWVLAVERWAAARKENQYLLYADMVEWQTRWVTCSMFFQFLYSCFNNNSGAANKK